MTTSGSHEPGHGSRHALPKVPFEIQGELGRGAHGVVYHVRVSEAVAALAPGGAGPREAALKVAMRHTGEDPEGAMVQYRRFLREARVLQRMEPHPHVVGVWDVGQTEAGEQWILLDLVSGTSLRRLMDSGPPSYERLVDIVLGVVTGLDHIHSCGVLHRDLKPDNILLDEVGSPRIGDFGLAQFSLAERSITASDEAVGTPLYMSPEMASFQADALGPWSDVFSLGVILFELISGRLPFLGRTAAEVLQAICTSEPEPLHPVNQQVPDALIEICRRALEKSPRRRYASCEALLNDLRRVDGFDQRAVVEQRPGSRGPGRWVRQWDSATRSSMSGSRRYGLTIAMGVLVAAAGLWAVVGTWSDPSSSEAGGGAEVVATPSTVSAEGDYTQERSGPVPQALEMLAGSPPRPESALEFLQASATAAGPPGALLQAELLGLLRADPAEAQAALDAAGLADSALGLAQSARLQADRGNDEKARRLLEQAGELAPDAGLTAAVERVYMGSEGAVTWLARRARQASRLAGRTGSGRWRAEADRLLRALVNRASGTGLASLARAEGHLERRQLGLAEESAGSALQASLDTSQRGAAFLVRARARLALGQYVAAAADAVAALNHGADPFVSGAVEVEALVAAGDPESVPRSQRLVKAALEADAARPRPWYFRYWRMRLLEIRSLAALGELRAALQGASALSQEVQRQLAFWRSPKRFARTSAGIDLTESFLRDPDDASGLVLLAMARLRHDNDLVLQRAGIADLVRASRWWVPAVLFWKVAREGPDQLGLVKFADKETLRGDGEPLTPDQQQLLEVLVALDGTGAAAADPRRALALNAKLLETDLLRPEVWLVQAQCLYELGRFREGEEALDLLRRLAPSVSESDVLELLYRDEEERQRLAVERLVTSGLGVDLIQAIWRMRDGGKLFPPGWERGGVSLRECLQALRTQRFLGLDLLPDVREGERRHLADSDGAGWALHWYLIGAARSLEAEEHSDEARRLQQKLQSRRRLAAAAELHAMQSELDIARSGARREFRSAAAAFERAAALGGQNVGPLAQVYRAAQAFALVGAGDADAGLEGLLTRCLRAQEQVMPLGRIRWRLMEVEPFYFQKLVRFHQFGFDRAALLAFRARVRLQRGDLQLAMHDAEQAATLHAEQSLVLVEVYEALLQKLSVEGEDRR